VGDKVATPNVGTIDQEPPPVASASTVVPPLAHNERVPVIASGIGFTVNVSARTHPVTPDVKVIVE
jgi:hypothetical protein